MSLDLENGRPSSSGSKRRREEGIGEDIDPRDTDTPAVHVQYPKKRVRLAEDASLEITRRKTHDAEISLEVDVMILDYLLYKVIGTCFSSPNCPAETQHPFYRVIHQANQFHDLFKYRRFRYKADLELQFRQALAQLTVLFTQRFVKNAATPNLESLRELRKQDQTRAQMWIGDVSRMPTVDQNTAPFDDELPIDPQALDLNRAFVLQIVNVPAEDDAYEDAFYGTSASVSLLDLLPLFMRLSALCQTMYSTPATEKWMELAAQWMLQACLEQYLVCGMDGSDAMDIAFAWGYHGQETENDPFSGEHDEEVRVLWESIKSRTLQKLFKGNEQSLVAHLRKVAAQNPIGTTERDILSFLQNLAMSIQAPILAQLDQGQLDGMSKEETRKFLSDCGIDLREICGYLT